MFDDAELSAFYPADYYAFTDRFTPKSFPLFKRMVRGILGLREFRTKDPKFDKPGKMLDVGCGSGWFISQMRDQGWDVMGVEPSAAAAEFGRSQRGLNIFTGSLLDAEFDTGSFDYVRLNHSLEHMSDPNRILAEIHRILANDGKLMVGVPDRESLNAKIFGPYWYHLALPLHAFSFSAETLKMMLDKHSFAVQKVIFNTDNAGIQGSIQFFLNRRKEPLGAEGSITDSRVARVLTVWVAYLENMLHLADCIEVTAVKKKTDYAS